MTLRVLVWGVVLALMALPALRGVDVERADQAWEAARLDKGDDLTARIYTEAGAMQLRVAPWQAGSGRAAARLRALGEARRGALTTDRGGLRRPVQPVR